MKSLFLTMCLVFGLVADVRAGIIASGFFSGTLEQFDPTTGVQSTFATVASATDPFPGISGLAWHANSNRIYATTRISQRVYSIDATSGSVLGFHQLAGNASPAGIAVDSQGNIYVANNGGNSISRFDSNFNDLGSIVLPDIGLGDNLPSGLAWSPSGELLISTFRGGGVFQWNPLTNSFSFFDPAPLANGMVAIDPNGNVYVGGAVFSNGVEKFSADGSRQGNPFLTIDSSVLPQPNLPYASLDFTSPAGVAIDADGNLLVAALGRTNPTNAADSFQNNGGLFLYSPDGALLRTFATQSTPFSSVISISAVPEPSTYLTAGLSLVVVVAFARWKRQRSARIV